MCFLMLDFTEYVSAYIILHTDPIWLNVSRQMIIKSHWITLLYPVEG